MQSGVVAPTMVCRSLAGAAELQDAGGCRMQMRMQTMQVQVQRMAVQWRPGASDSEELLVDREPERETVAPTPQDTLGGGSVSGGLFAALRGVEAADSRQTLATRLQG